MSFIREFARPRPITQPGGTWPTSTHRRRSRQECGRVPTETGESSHMHSRRPGLTWQPSRCFGTKRDDLPFIREFVRLRPITQPGGTWPTSTHRRRSRQECGRVPTETAETSHIHFRRPGLTWQPSRCFGTKRGDLSFIREFAELRPVTQPGGTWPTSTNLESGGSVFGIDQTAEQLAIDAGREELRRSIQPRKQGAAWVS
ncbi:DUF1589 domain-containing protein [Rhodopirellula islandica]|uniref:DUF1589 domain-containing protein n=1 Tax=Rhodopirellula islandica TaxID=595434 RepID=UPI0009FA1928